MQHSLWKLTVIPGKEADEKEAVSQDDPFMTIRIATSWGCSENPGEPPGCRGRSWGIAEVFIRKQCLC